MEALQRRGGWCKPPVKPKDYSLRSRHSESVMQIGMYGRVRYQARGYDCTLQRGRSVRQPGWYRGDIPSPKQFASGTFCYREQ